MIVSFKNCQRRADILFQKFISDYELAICEDKFEQKMSYTYKNGSYSYKIDHILTSELFLNKVRKCEILSMKANNSDHNPISIEFDLDPDQPYCEVTNSTLYRFPWHSNLFIESYKSSLNVKIKDWFLSIV